MNLQEAIRDWNSVAPMLAAQRGIVLPEAKAWLPDGFARDVGLAMDAQPTLGSTPNAGIPAFLTTFVDPQIYEWLFAEMEVGKILGEEKRGDWTTQTEMFPTVEHTGETNSYSDYNEVGLAGINSEFPQRQSILFQTIQRYGELEMARYGLAKISYVSELDKASATVLARFQNLTYTFGVNGLQNYGITNDPSLSASITPSVKAWGGNGWLNGGVVAATANEVYTDIQSLFVELVNQSGGLVKMNTKMVLVFSPAVSVAMTAVNSFGVDVSDLLKKNYPNIRIETPVQYGKITTSNPQGIAAGNLVQLIAEEVQGQRTGFSAFNEKLRAHSIVRETSSFKQKKTAGSWGTVLRMPLAVASMIGV